MLLGGVVHEDVEPPERIDRRLDCLLALALPADVAAMKQAAPPLLLDQSRGLARVFLFLKIVDEDIRTFPRECHGHGTTDPRIAARHERDPVLKASTAFQGRVFILGSRPHLGLPARLMGLRLFRSLRLLVTLVLGFVSHGCSLAGVAPSGVSVTASPPLPDR